MFILIGNSSYTFIVKTSKNEQLLYIYIYNICVLYKYIYFELWKTVVKFWTEIDG